MKTIVRERLCSREVERIVDAALGSFGGPGRGAPTVARTERTWKAFARFAGDEPFTTGLVGRYLLENGIAEDAQGAALTHRQLEIRRAMRHLTEFKFHGFFHRVGITPDKVVLAPQLEAIRSGYEQFCRDRLGHRPQTLKLRRLIITRYLMFLDVSGVRSTAEITPASLPAFVVQEGHLKPRWVATVCCALRSLLDYLCVSGLVAHDLRSHVPEIRVPRDAPIPTRWQAHEVESLLSTVDRSSPVGKRDYAILLLAARLGMRSGDIRNLRLENLDWENATMEFIQEKTRAPQRLPLSEEVGTALIDYLRHGRPVTSNGEVFLGLIPPFSPFKDVGSLHRIITMYRRRAGIGIPATRKGGMHALRHSLATRLLEAGTPLETISSVMGHVSPESTLAYVKASAETLRTVALEWEATHE